MHVYDGDDILPVAVTLQGLLVSVPRSFEQRMENLLSRTVHQTAGHHERR